MICYQFDSSGYYTGTAESTVLPNGSDLLPPNSVAVAPPEEEANCRLRWIGEWVNEEIPPEFVPDPVAPEPEPTLEELKEKKRKEIEAARWEAETGGVDWHRVTDGKVYRLDTTDRGCLKVSNARQIAQAQGDAYVPQLWKTETGWFEATVADLTSMGLTIGTHVQNCFDKEAELMAQVEKAKTKKDLNKIKWQ